MTADEKRLRQHVFGMTLRSHGIELDSHLDRRGRFFTPAPLPAGGLAQLMGAFSHPGADCYVKSALLARDDSSLDYAEGWAIAPDGVPTRHAWCVDGQGRVVDAHWPTPEALTYFGIVVPRDFGYDWRDTFTAGQAYAMQQRDLRMTE